jgi:hypothetical protein
MRLLAQGVPLTLLLDLLVPPDAAELYARERSTSVRTPTRSTLPDPRRGSSPTTSS